MHRQTLSTSQLMGRPHLICRELNSPSGRCALSLLEFLSAWRPAERSATMRCRKRTTLEISVPSKVGITVGGKLLRGEALESGYRLAHCNRSVLLK